MSRASIIRCRNDYEHENFEISQYWFRFTYEAKTSIHRSEQIESNFHREMFTPRPIPVREIFFGYGFKI